MNSGLLVSEMVATVERERVVMIAQLSRNESFARAGQVDGKTGRVRRFGDALLRRMGRSRQRGSAPAAGPFSQVPSHSLDLARYGNAPMTIARLTKVFPHTGS
jgi:hypothetical protein